MLMYNQPIAIYFAVNGSISPGQVNHLTFRIGPADMLDRVAVAKRAVGFDVHVADLELHRSLEQIYEAFPVRAECLGTNILARRDGIEYD